VQYPAAWVQGSTTSSTVVHAAESSCLTIQWPLSHCRVAVQKPSPWVHASGDVAPPLLPPLLLEPLLDPPLLPPLLPPLDPPPLDEPLLEPLPDPPLPLVSAVSWARVPLK
jgi:hypothetical protein